VALDAVAVVIEVRVEELVELVVLDRAVFRRLVDVGDLNRHSDLRRGRLDTRRRGERRDRERRSGNGDEPENAILKHGGTR
jgi:hypothetical protein